VAGGDRLGEVRVETRASGTSLVFDGAVARYRQERKMREFAVRANFSSDGVTVAAGEPQIAKDDVGGESSNGLHPVFARRFHANLVSGSVEDFTEALSRVRIVLEHENACAWGQ
jgi:hypothetical protein